MPAFQPLKNAELYIMLILADHDAHGYLIMQEVKERTGGAVRMGPGTLYTTLKRLRDRGWITEVDSPAEPPPDNDERRRYYHLADRGRAVLRAETQRLARLVRYAQEVGLLQPPSSRGYDPA